MTQPLPLALAQAARERPGGAVFQMVGEPAWTFAAMQTHVDLWRQALAVLGVRAGDHVATLIPTSADAVGLWLGLGWLRAVEAPVNPEYRGALLEQVLAYCEARVVVAHRRYADAVAEVADGLPLRPLVLVLDDGDDAPASRLSRLSGDVASAAAHAGVSADEVPPRPQDLALMLFTSGTTGSPKGVMVPWRQITAGAGLLDLSGPVRAYCVAPLFHTSGRGALAGAVLNRHPIVFRERFSGSNFWADIERHDCNLAHMLASFLAFLGQTPPPDEVLDRSPLRYVGTGRVPAAFRPIADRLGLRFATVFNMTELSSPIASRAWSRELDGSCGYVRDGYACRVVDEDDGEVPIGEVGELIIRADEPWALMQGYWRRPEETQRAWRNLWFHTGDLFRKDVEGRFHFESRKEDRIRRRGENISSEEIETVALKHPAVEAGSAVGVDSEVWDQDIKLVVVRRPGLSLTATELHAFMGRALPAFMVPRYIDFAEDLPRTPTGKAKRALLRRSGVTPTTWDALAAAPDGFGEPAEAGTRSIV